MKRITTISLESNLIPFLKLQLANDPFSFFSFRSWLLIHDSLRSQEMQSASLVCSLNSLFPSCSSTLPSSFRFQPAFPRITDSLSSFLHRSPLQNYRSAPATQRSPGNFFSFGMLCANPTNYFHYCLCRFYVISWNLWSSMTSIFLFLHKWNWENKGWAV